MSASKSPLFGSLFALLFSLPFAGVGVGATFWIWQEVARSRDALEHWREVPAKVLETNLESRRGSKGGVSYLTTGRFAYEFEGNAYESPQLNFGSGSDNIGSFQQRLYGEMKAAKNAGRPLPCRVNPGNPSEAVLKPEWRPEMALFKAVFAVIFGGVGFGMMGASLGGTRQSAVQGRLRKKYPREPWLWRKDWHSSSLHSHLGGGAAGGLFVIILAHAATLPLWSVLGREWSLGGVFPWVLSGVLLVVLAVTGVCGWFILHWWKFRGTRVELEGSPVFLGGPLKARLFLPRSLPAGAKLDFKLACVHSVVTGSGKHSKTTTKEIWSHAESLTGPFAPGQPLAFVCDLPEDAPPTDQEDSRDTHLWKLTAQADIPGVDLKVDFDLPVFAAPLEVS